MKIIKVFLWLFLFGNIQLKAQIRLPKLISDNIVLQRDQPIKVWGWASPKEKISLIFNKKNYFQKVNGLLPYIFLQKNIKNHSSLGLV